MEVTRALIFTSGVPKFLWGEALLTSTYLINRMPSRVLDFKTPFSMFKTYFPTSRLTTDLPLRVFGCSVFVHVHVHDHNRSKLDPRAKKSIFVGDAP
uniref:Putative ovule protein n=1 Tax=Solanum chacoense TaxID=4108 RepID=A0A0V0GJR5_SOLCH